MYEKHKKMINEQQPNSAETTCMAHLAMYKLNLKSKEK